MLLLNQVVDLQRLPPLVLHASQPFLSFFNAAIILFGYPPLPPFLPFTPAPVLISVLLDLSLTIRAAFCIPVSRFPSLLP